MMCSMAVCLGRDSLVLQGYWSDGDGLWLVDSGGEAEVALKTRAIAAPHEALLVGDALRRSLVRLLRGGKLR